MVGEDHTHRTPATVLARSILSAARTGARRARKRAEDKHIFRGNYGRRKNPHVTHGISARETWVVSWLAMCLSRGAFDAGRPPIRSHDEAARRRRQTATSPVWHDQNRSGEGARLRCQDGRHDSIVNERRRKCRRGESPTERCSWRANVFLSIDVPTDVVIETL